MSGTTNSTAQVNLTALDFASYKQALKTFLQSQSQFKDYNFDASNMSVLLDVLSYNTYQNAFYMNMVSSEMFLDTAQLRDSVVLRAKELNYLPRSFRSAVATVDIAVANVPNNPLIITIPSGTSFTGRAGSNNYTFSTDVNLALTADANGVFTASNVSIIEGISVTDTFVVTPQSNTQTQRFVLSNPNVDTDTVTVLSIENNGANTVPYLRAQTLLDLTSNSAAYFIQGGNNSKYEVIFGDNVVGRRPPDGSVIAVNYLASSGQLPNGINVFTPDSAIANSGNVVVTTISSAAGGDISESITSIKFNAPRYYATQERAVTTRDYETLLSSMYPEIQAISAYGGESLPIPQYGKVFISLKLYNYDQIPQSKITEYTSFLSTRAPTTVITQFVEPSYLYASVTSTVKYNINQTTLQPSDVEAFVISAIQSYNNSSLTNYKVSLYYSKLVEAIDNALTSIVSNQTDYKLMIKLSPNMTSAQNYQLNFGSPLITSLPPAPSIRPSSDDHAINSTLFYYNGVLTRLQDDGQGNLVIVEPRNDGNDYTVASIGVGTVDYSTGVVNLSSFYASGYIGTEIRIYATLPDSVKDTSVTGNTILEIPNDEIHITVIPVRV